MSNVLRIALVDPDDKTRDELKSTMMGMTSVWLEAECSRYEFFADVVGQTNPKVVFIALDSDTDRGVELIAEISSVAPDCSILVGSSSTDGSLILQAMRAGAKEFLTQPVSPEDMAAALQRVSRQHFGVESSSSKGCKTFAITGATGGVGSTSLAVNLGCALAADPENSVVLVDLDLALGDADVLLDTIPEYSLTDVSQNIARLDLTLLKRSLTKHSSGMYFLPRPVNLEDARQVTQEDITRVIGLLKASFTHLIFDTSKGFSGLDMLAFESADDVLMVTQLDLPCLRNVVRLNTSFDQIDKLQDRVKIIVNRVGQDSGQISLKKAQDTLGREIYWQIPNDYRVMVEVRNNGVPLIQQAPRAAITQSISQLGTALCGNMVGQASGESSKSRSWLSLWPVGKPAGAGNAKSEPQAT